MQAMSTEGTVEAHRHEGRRGQRGRPPARTWPVAAECTACQRAPTARPSATRRLR